MVLNKLKQAVVHMLLLALCFVWIYPFLWMLAASFKSQDEFFQNSLSLIPGSLDWSNYMRAWNVANFDQYFFNSVLVTTAVIIIVLFITATCGYALGRYSFPGKKLIMFVLAASMFVPLEFSIIPIFQLIKDMGLLNSLLGIILAESGGGHVLFVLLFASFFAQVPKELEEAGIMDGCGFIRTFASIILPLSKPIIGSVVIMQFIWTWNSFLLPLVLTLSKPDIRTLAVGLYSLRGENVVDWTGIAAGGAIALLPIIIIFILLQRFFVNGMAGAVKG